MTHTEQPALVVDVDGTLVDTNYEHSIAWSRALRSVGHTVPVAAVHRHVGMGGDQIVSALIGDEAERECGDEARSVEGAIWRDLIGTVTVLPGAREALAALSARGHCIVLASSAKEWEVEHYLGLLDAGSDVDAWTTSADVDATKPAPDVVEAALARAGTRHAAMVGDTVWDVEAATRAGIPAIGVLTGGFSGGELRDAGAAAVLPSVAELPAALSAGLLQGAWQREAGRAAPANLH